MAAKAAIRAVPSTNGTAARNSIGRSAPRKNWTNHVRFDTEAPSLNFFAGGVFMTFKRPSAGIHAGPARIGVVNA
jgi:hypothetical protein